MKEQVRFLLGGRYRFALWIGLARQGTYWRIPPLGALTIAKGIGALRTSTKVDKKIAIQEARELVRAQLVKHWPQYRRLYLTIDMDTVHIMSDWLEDNGQSRIDEKIRGLNEYPLVHQKRIVRGIRKILKQSIQK